MPSSRTRTEIKEGIAIEHRVALGLTALTFGAATLGLAVALLAVPGGTPNQIFQGTETVVRTNSTADAVTLTWTAPGDDGNTGQATAYDLRYSTGLLTAGNFSSATPVAGEPAPSPAGTTESFTVGGLSPDTTYYFALKTTDEAGNQSTISNVLAATTSALAQACIPEYQCSSWSGCVNGTMTRTCSVTNSCPAGLGAPITEQSCTVPPGGAGGAGDVTNPMVVAGLAPGNQPKVRVLDTRTLARKKEFVAFSKTNARGVYVAAGDLNADQRAEVVVGSGPGVTSTVAIFTDGGIRRGSFKPFGSTNTTGVAVGVGDIDGDGSAEIVAAPASGAGAIKVFRYNPTNNTSSLVTTISLGAYRGGVSIVVSDVNLNGQAEIIMAKKVSSRTVTVYTWNGSKFTSTASWVAYPIIFKSGLTVTAGDITGDGRPEIMTVAGRGYWSDVKVFSGSGKFVTNVIPFSKSFFGGANMTTHDLNSDGQAEILVSPASGAAPFIRSFRYNQVTRKLRLLSTINVFPITIRTGLRLGGI